MECIKLKVNLSDFLVTISLIWCGRIIDLTASVGKLNRERKYFSAVNLATIYEAKYDLR